MLFAVASGALGGVIILIIQVALAPSRIYKEQKNKINDFEDKVSKKLRLEFNKDFHQETQLTKPTTKPYFGSSAPPEFTLSRGNNRTNDHTDSTSGTAYSISRPWSDNDGKYFYVKVIPIGNILIKGCSVLLTLIEKFNDNSQVWEKTTYKDLQYLKWGGDESVDAYFPREIPPIDGMNADILFIKSNNDVVLTTKNRLINHQKLFTSPGKFRLTISAYSSEQGEAPRIYIIFNWTGDWKTAYMIPENEME